MALHSKLGASSMYRWSACPASVRLCEGVESRSSKYAEEGTFAHDLAAKMLLGEPDLKDVDDELLDSVLVYVRYIRDRMKLATKHFIEEKFELSAIDDRLFGTADCVLYFEGNKHLAVIDYKHGKGIPVEVLEGGKPNLQLVYYALGAYLKLKLPAETVEICIVQPRCGHPDGVIRRHEFSSFELLEFAADLKEAADKTDDPQAAFAAGDHCRFCPAAFKCPELNKKAVATAQMDFKSELTDTKQISQTLTMVDVLEDWCKSVREYAYDLASKGTEIPGYKLVEKRATRRWKNDEETTAEALECVLVDPDIYYERSLKSPAQIEKIVGKKGMADLSDLIISQSSGLALVPESDKRQAAKQDAITVFKNAEVEELI